MKALMSAIVPVSVIVGVAWFADGDAGATPVAMSGSPLNARSDGDPDGGSRIGILEAESIDERHHRRSGPWTSRITVEGPLGRMYGASATAFDRYVDRVGIARRPHRR